MAESFKDRDEHRGNPAPHLGQDHYEKSRTEAAASRDRGPTFTSEGGIADYHEQPQQPADVTHQAQYMIEKGSTSQESTRPKALEEAVEDLDSGLTGKPV